MQVKIEKVVSGALGLAHSDGKTLFIQNALKDEVVDVSILEEKKNYTLCRADRIIRKSEDRIDAECMYYSSCGGCDFAYVDGRSSARIKTDIVLDNFKRVGKVDYDFSLLPPSFSDTKGYRIRVRFHVDQDKGEIGFLAKRGNKLIPINNCLCLSDKLDSLLSSKTEIIEAARKIKLQNGLNKNGYVEVSLLEGDDGISFFDDPVNIKIGSLVYKASSSVFFQSNIKLLPVFLDFIKQETIGKTVVDLYSGVGTFSALFPERSVYSVESNKDCLKYARLNAPTAHSVTKAVEDWSRKARLSDIDTLIVDPPRIGLNKSVISSLLALNPKKIIYASCDSVTLSRDISLLKPYCIQKVKIFDFYPGTSHVETVVSLSRK